MKAKKSTKPTLKLKDLKPRKDAKGGTILTNKPSGSADYVKNNYKIR